MASDRPDTWQDEAFIHGAREIGMEMPDEVVVLHYDDPVQGQRFHDANPDVLQEIGAFNRDHLVTFTYVAAVAE